MSGRRGLRSTALADRAGEKARRNLDGAKIEGE
jgi:hypothetical protein